jgi:UDP-N-acetylmuramoyl-L-alanyl-D-glutamate--2,6-diaminopimelate ligase
MVKAGQDFSVVVDFAHNAASLENLLNMLKEYRNGRIITVFGCGGDRAKDRRFEMGEVSGKLSDLTVITSDNPRTEDPISIIEDIEEGIRRTRGEYIKIPDRLAGIERALKSAKKGDIVVIAGKGHETTQVFSDRTAHFDDVETAYNILRGMKVL